MGKNINLTVGNDNGNSEQDIVINGDVICQPNVYVPTNELPNLEELNTEYIAKNIHDNLIVTITSNSLNNGTPSTYYIGKYATETGSSLRNIEVGVINSKLNSDVPVINTLGHLAGYAVREAYLEDKGVEQVDVVIEMCTGLPVNQYSNKNSQEFADKYLKEEHKVTVYLGSKKVQVNLKFEYVKVLPEGVPTVFYLQSLEPKQKEYKEILKEFLKDYRLTESDISFNKKRILHVSIGEGTTENPLTEGIKFNPHFIKGSNNGVGHAINEILQDFRDAKRLSKFSRQEFSAVLKDENHKYHEDAMEYMQTPLEDQALVIQGIAEREIGKANNDLDYICVYGGGSILMKKYLKSNLKKFGEQVEIKVLYIPKPYAVIVEGLGMYEFAKSNIFKSLKKVYTENKKDS